MTILGVKNQKPPKIGANSHFPAKMPKSYNCSISKRVALSLIKLNFDTLIISL